MKRIILISVLTFSGTKLLACPDFSGIYECSSVNDNGVPGTYTQSVYQGFTSTNAPFYTFVNVGETYLRPFLRGAFIADGVARSFSKLTYTMVCSSAVVNLQGQETAESQDGSTQVTYNWNMDLFLNGNDFIKRGEAVILKPNGTSQTVDLEEVCTRREAVE